MINGMGNAMNKTILSFYCDDTNHYCAPPEAFKTFLDFVAAEGIAGESSVIIGSGWQQHGLLSRPTTDAQFAYLEQVRRAYSCGIDSHFELMTHSGRFDFAKNQVPDGAIPEGLWLFEPAVTVTEYEAYFHAIISEGERVGVRFTGLTQPGCSCDACKLRYRQLCPIGQTVPTPNPNVWQALLNLAKSGKFRGHTVPCFFDGDNLGKDAAAPATRKAGDGRSGVYNLMPNATDRFGIWTNDPTKVDPDYYISANGQLGRIVDLVRARVPYCLFFAHWQSLNPANGVGWKAFTQVIQRVQKHLHQEVVWMRPSEYTDLLQNSSRSGPPLVK